MGRAAAREHLPGTYRYWLNGSALDKRPAQKLAVVACMDARLHVPEVLALRTGDANIIRNANAAFRRALRRATGHDPGGLTFHGFPHLAPHRREQVRRIRYSPFIPRTVAVKGLLFDVRNGALREVA